jgi:WD40 repeat protein
VRADRWLGLVAIALLVTVACSAVQPPRSTQSNSSSASSTRQQPQTCSDLPPSRFEPSVPSNANLEIVQFKGSDAYLVRDITDIPHPVTLAIFTARIVGPQFVSAGEVSFVDAAGLELMRISSSSKTLVNRCPSQFAWSPDGTILAFVSENEELHLVTSGQNRVVAALPTSPGGFGCESQGCADDWEFRLRYSPNGAFISLVQWPTGEFRIWTSDGKVLAGSDYTSTNPSRGISMSVWSGNSFYFRDTKGVDV